MYNQHDRMYLGIPHISTFIIDRIAKAMRKRGLEIYESGEGKLLAMSPALDVRFKFELLFSANDFNVTVLGAREDDPDGEMSKLRQDCFAWTDSKRFKAFNAFLKSLADPERNVVELEQDRVVEKKNGF